MPEEIRWRDADRDRSVLLREGLAGELPAALADEGWDEFELLSTERALADAPGLSEAAGATHLVPHGQVPDVAAEVLDDVGSDRLVALGGGRVIDAAKGIAAVREGEVAAVPTTMSGAEMTAIHRLPAGHEGVAGVRPSLVLADPGLMTSAPEADLRASSMNALAHGADSLYTPLANPVSEMAALRGAKLIAQALDKAPAKRDPAKLALGSLLSAYALDSALFGLHHVVCQTLVRELRIPHAETNATMLPHTLEMLRSRAGPQMTALARALGAKQGDLAQRVAELGGGPRRLSQLGAEQDGIEAAVKAIIARPELQLTPDVPGAREIRELIETAW